MKHPSEKSVEVSKSMMDRLNRIEGQIRGIKKMIENETYCDDVIHQIEAARSGLKSIEMLLLESHIRNCVVDQIQSNDLSVVDEVLTTFRKMVK